MGYWNLGSPFVGGGMDFWCPPATGNAVTDTAALTLQINAALAAGVGRVMLQATPSATPYSLNASLPTINLPTVSLIGPGVSMCVLKPTSAVTGDAVSCRMSPFTTVKAGIVGGFQIDMSSAAAGACGFHYGDVISLGIDLGIYNASGAGSKGAWQDNQTNWTERCYGRYDFLGNKTNLLFDVNAGNPSHARSEFIIEQNVATGNSGVVMQNGSHVYESFLRIKGNGAGTATYIKLLDTALFDGSVDIGMEGNGATPTGFSSAAGTSFIANGTMELYRGALTNSAAGTFTFTGFRNTPGIA